MITVKVLAAEIVALASHRFLFKTFDLDVFAKAFTDIINSAIQMIN